MKKHYLFVLIFLYSLSAPAQSSLPDISLKSLNGQTVDLSALPHDKLTVFSFWATWCVPCINELDAINEYYDDWKNETGVNLIAVAVDNARSLSKVRPLVNGKMWTYEVLLDQNQDFMRAMNIVSVPYLILVNKGEIVYSHSGYTPGFEDELFDIITEYSLKK